MFGIPDFPLLLVILLALAIGVAIVWWARKAARHPEWAQRKEQQFDSALEVAKAYTPAQIDAALDAVRAIEWQKVGAQAYIAGRPLVQALREKAHELLRRADELERGSPGDRA
jgi:hypothetical protein